MKRASYRAAIAFIAYNDEPGDDSVLDDLISVVLVADLFGKETEEVARAVRMLRAKAWRT